MVTSGRDNRKLPDAGLAINPLLDLAVDHRDTIQVALRFFINTEIRKTPVDHPGAD